MSNKTRTEAFSDGVFAVAITLLVIDIHVPAPLGTDHPSLASRLGDQWPSYAAYVVSFLTIGIIWINHHAYLERLRAVDQAVMLLNVLLLMAVVAIPFSTALMAEYLREESGATTAAVVYGGTFLVMSGLFWLCQWHALIHREDLRADRITPAARRDILRKNAIGQLPYTAAIIGAFVSPYVTIVICFLVGVFYALPSTTRDQEGAAVADGD